MEENNETGLGVATPNPEQVVPPTEQELTPPAEQPEQVQPEQPSQPEQAAEVAQPEAVAEQTSEEAPKYSAENPQPMPAVIESAERVLFAGQHVAAVLQDGKELRDSNGLITHYHCTLADGSTAHVPVSNFIPVE